MRGPYTTHLPGRELRLGDQPGRDGARAGSDPRLCRNGPILRSGGSHIFTIPQNVHLLKSVTRARLDSGKVEHIFPPEYHGDPVRAEGALVFTGIRQ